jgi:hypothetical protein
MPELSLFEDSDLNNFIPVSETGVISSDFRGAEPAREVPAERKRTREAVKKVTSRMTAASERQKRRTVEYVERRETSAIFFPVDDIELALMRRGAGNELMTDLINLIRVARYKVIPPGLIVEKKGKKYLDLSVLTGDDPELLEQLKQIHGAYELFTFLDRDLTLQGRHSTQVLEFKRKRIEIAEKMADHVRRYGQQRVDFDYELAGPETGHTFPSEETKEDCKEVQDYCQAIMDRIHAVSGLNNIRPRVHLTRSGEANAFVWSEHGEEGIKNLLEIAKTGQMVELPVYIHLGLLGKIKYDDELAGIFAHELTHIMQPSFGRTRSREESQRFEYDADKSAIHLSDAAGFNPRGLINIFKDFQRGDDFIARLGGSSHPETLSRITELEKEYHRRDLPLINSSKRLKPKPARIATASDKIKQALELKISATNLWELEARRELDEYLAGYSGADLYFRGKDEKYHNHEGFNQIVHEIALLRLRNAVIQQELVHGTLGFRERMLEAMKHFVMGVKLADANTDPNVRYDFKLPRADFKDISRIPDVETYFSVPKEEKYLSGSDNMERLLLNNPVEKFPELNTATQQAGMGMDLDQLPSTVEEWINTDNQYTDLFWRQYDKDGIRDKKKRLKILMDIMLDYVTRAPGYDYYDPLHGAVIGIKKSTDKTRIKRIPVKPEVSGVLELLPERLRTQKRKKAMEIEYKEETEKLTEKSLLMRSDGKKLLLPHNMRQIDYLDQPPLIRRLAEIVHDKSIESYQEILTLDGREVADPKVIEFILLNFYHCSDGGQLNNVLMGLERPTITFLDQVVRVLESKNLVHSFDDPVRGRAGGHAYFIAAYISVIAFGLKPGNDEEKALKKKYLQRVAVDPFFAGNRGMAPDYNLYWETDEKIMEYFDEEFVVSSGPLQHNYDLSQVSLRSLSPSVSAKWLLNREEFMEEMHSVLTLTEEPPAGLSVREFERQRIKKRLLRRPELRSLVEKMLKKVKDKREEKDGVIDKLLVVTALMRKYLDKTYLDLPNHEAVIAMFEIENQWYQHPGNKPPEIIRLMVKEIAKKVDLTSLRKYLAMDNEKISDEHLLLDVFWGSPTSEDRISRYQEVTYLSNENHANRGLDAFVSKFVSRYVCYLKDSDELDGTTYQLYRNRETRISTEGRVEKSTVFEWLEALAETRPGARELLEFLKKEKIEVYDVIGSMCLGNFERFTKVADAFISEYCVPGERKKVVRNLIKITRLCGEIYSREWKNIDEYKRLDEQTSNWEWVYDNPFFGEIPQYIDYKLEKNHNKSFMSHIIKSYGDTLGGYYRIESGSAIKFSWPLLMIDLWNDKLDLTFIMNDKERAEIKKMLDIILQRIKEVIADDSNLNAVKKMQPGFFKEFILEEKMKRVGITFSLDAIEEWLPHFSSFPHEASENNQIFGKVEQVRNEITGKRKKALIAEAVEQVLPADADPDAKKMIVADTSKYLQRMMVSIDCDVHINWYADKIDDKEKREAAEKEAADLLGRYKLEILKKYRELIEEEYARLREQVSLKEEDVYLFSDHVIENDKSRLEVGPVYRFQLIAQPLMDWHIEKLRSAGSRYELIACGARVDRLLPNRHPLKDIYLKNQLNFELWNLLKGELGEQRLAEMGISLKEALVDLAEVFEHFPLYRDVSFLKNYSVFKLDGLIEKFQDLPPGTASNVMEILVRYLEDKVSEVSRPAMRRLLFLMEEKAVWPWILAKKESDPAMFEKYLSHIERFYPDPSLERDNLLETVMMDLATNHEQVDKVLNLRYAEQVLLPEQKESLAVKAQYQAFEKIRFYVSMMDQVERAEFIIWLMGGDPPLSNTLAIQSTGCSLDGRKEVFWQMTPNERRNLLYDILQDREGLFREASFGSYHHQIPDRPFKVYTESQSMIKHVVEEIFETTFEGLLINEKLPNDHEENIQGRDIIKTIFMGLFTEQNDPVRRTELLINIIEAIGTARKEGRKLGTPELIRLMAEQGGVVVVKFAQVLSEQPGLLPDSIKEALADLKDSATVVSKKSDFTYLQATGWLSEDIDGIAEVGSSIGSASIKQCRIGITRNGERVAIKTKKPSIEKYYRDDLKVVGKILELLEEKYEIPSYLITEVEKVINEELDFGREVDNHLALRDSLNEREAVLVVEIAGREHTFPVEVVEPLSIYPNSASNDAAVGLMIEEFAWGLSLKEIQKYHQSLRKNDLPVLVKMRKRLSEVYGGQAREMEEKIKKINLENLQAGIALEFLKQVMDGGVFHADLHAGNIFFDLRPCTRNGQLHEGKAILIDLGSMGYSQADKMPQAVKKESGEEMENFDAREEFRDFLSALFSQSDHSEKLAAIINKYTGLDWSKESVAVLLGGSLSTQQKVKKIFYEILKASRDKGDAVNINMQFRYFLKAIATSADHLDKLKDRLTGEMMYIFSMGGQIPDEERRKMFFTILQEENLLNFGLLF